MKTINYTIGMNVPNIIKQINHVFIAEGYELHLVGGCVRDAILGVKPKDWDLVTNATPDEVISILKGCHFITNILETGKAFGIVNAVTAEYEFEIATFRSDGDYSDARRPDSVVFADIQTDALRRDLTCNALFYNLRTSEIIDLVGGVDDIKNGIVRTVGSARDRFGEDRLRILRAIRFAARFGCDLDLDIIDTLTENNSLKGISCERIRDEFIKGIKSAKSVTNFLNLIDKYGLFEYIYPNVILNHYYLEIKDPILVIANLLIDTSHNIGPYLKELTYSNDEVKQIEFLKDIFYVDSDTTDIIDLKRRHAKVELTDFQIMTFATYNQVSLRTIMKFLKFELSVTGQEVMERFNIEAGPKVGTLIKNLEMANYRKLL